MSASLDDPERQVTGHESRKSDIHSRKKLPSGSTLVALDKPKRFSFMSERALRLARSRRAS